MEFICILILLVIAIILLAIIYGINLNTIKDIKKVEKCYDLNEITDIFPSNIEVCKQMLKKLNNIKVKVEENKESETSLYIAVSDKISIANVKNNFTRIQTIAHECLHSIQNRKILLFNFWFSNFYLLYFIAAFIILVLKLLPYKMLFILIFILLSFIYYFIRSYLENDAMIKARYLAKEYMDEQNLITKEQITKVVSKYDYINDIGIKLINFNLFFSCIIKAIILVMICVIR